jgi:hypothetical protein
MLHTIIQLHKLINYYWSFCLCSNLNSFRLNYIVLSGIFVQYFSMKIFFVEIKYVLVLILKVSKYWPMKLLIVQTSSHATLLRSVWRFKRGNQNPYIEDQTTKLTKEKVQKETQRSTKHTYKTKGRVTWILPFRSIHGFIDLKIYIDVGLRFYLLKKNVERLRNINKKYRYVCY